jgi:hypothetical protein
MRKLNNIIGLLGPAVTVVLAGYAGCSAEWAIILFSASVGLSAFTIPGAKSRFDFHLCMHFIKAMKSSPLLGPFCVSEFWGFSLLKI